MLGQLWRGAGRTGRVAGDAGYSLGPHAVGQSIFGERQDQTPGPGGTEFGAGAHTGAQRLSNMQSADKSG